MHQTTYQYKKTFFHNGSEHTEVFIARNSIEADHKFQDKYPRAYNLYTVTTPNFQEVN